MGAPLLLLIDPRLVPGPLLCAALVILVLLTRREWHGIRFRDLGWSLPGRLVGTAAALAFLDLVPPERLAPALGVLILVGIALSGWGIELPLTRAAFIGAGAVSGFFSTVAAIGGPPIALLYQRERGTVVRGTLSAFFVVGVVISIAGLALAGRFGMAELRMVPVLLPGALVGYWLSGPAARVLDRGWLRPAILIFSAATGLMVVLKYLLR
jgi:uncharacterized membrane protein YfcA